MRTFDEYVRAAGEVHGHICAGQILGLRMALHGLALLGLDDPEGKDRKRLVTFVEIDRCATDAIAVVTGCRLGKRALKFRDYGKMAATFFDLETGRAVRVAAKESARARAREMHPEIADPKEQQKRAYREMAEAELFDSQWVRVEIAPEDRPGYKGPRVDCARCGERIDYRREVMCGEETLCRACAGDSYYEPLES